ncbi:MarR family transcriptional regulator [Streptomyces sp. NPDC051940]|uniref:MarR family winged helix-turn-helix transcriptional regulator n=1 Tax=Streptomyces sp. NPDC051940 TaxID=3155675 RepID=UPI0034443BCF
MDHVLGALEAELAVFYRRARAVSAELARSVHPELEPAAYALLVRLAESGEQRATDIACYFGVGKATMSRQLRTLEELGLIERAADPNDRRASLVRLTAGGRQRVEQARSARREQWVRRLSAWERDEVVELARLLRRFNELNAEG